MRVVHIIVKLKTEIWFIPPNVHVGLYQCRNDYGRFVWNVNFQTKKKNKQIQFSFVPNATEVSWRDNMPNDFNILSFCGSSIRRANFLNIEIPRISTIFDPTIHLSNWFRSKIWGKKIFTVYNDCHHTFENTSLHIKCRCESVTHTILIKLFYRCNWGIFTLIWWLVSIWTKEFNISNFNRFFFGWNTEVQLLTVANYFPIQMRVVLLQQQHK